MEREVRPVVAIRCKVGTGLVMDVSTMEMAIWHANA